MRSRKDIQLSFNLRIWKNLKLSEKETTMRPRRPFVEDDGSIKKPPKGGDKK